MFPKIIHTLFCILFIVASAHCMEQKKSQHIFTELEQTFFQAAIDGKLETVKDCIARNVNINAEDKNGETALFLAIYWGQPEVAIHLLQQKNIEVNTISKTARSQRTLLHFACSKGTKYGDKRKQLIAHLIAAGANLDAQNIYHETPLHDALSLPFSEPVELLVAAGASMIPRPNGLTPLQEADSEQNIGHVRALLKSPKITLLDIEQAVIFNRNSRQKLLREARGRLGECFRYTVTYADHELAPGLRELFGITQIPAEHCLSNQTLKTYNNKHEDLQLYFELIHEKLDGARLLNEAARQIDQVKAHQEIYHALFSCYRTWRMLELAKPPANKQCSRLSRLPSDILKMMPALAAQSALLSKDDIKKIC